MCIAETIAELYVTSHGMYTPNTFNTARKHAFNATSVFCAPSESAIYTIKCG